MNRPFMELRELEPGQRFMFYADDLTERGPCTLVSKGAGGAVIMYEPHTVTKTFKARNLKTGEMVEKTITQHLSGESRCALGAQVVPLPALPVLTKTVDRRIDSLADLQPEAPLPVDRELDDNEAAAEDATWD